MLPALLTILAISFASTLAQDLTVESIRGAGNNSLFTRWRPTAHIMAPAGWMNDPCGAMYDPVRSEYHIFYQWHPNHVNWGNISWGHAVSTDLVSWTDVGGWNDSDAEALGPAGNGTYNGLGIFSGTAQPVNIRGEIDGNLTIFYTSVKYLPTSWSIPYTPGTESQSLATSSDGGQTWQEYEGNPVIKGPPSGWNITGFRDPFVQSWPEMDSVLGQTESHYYAVFGSGIKEVGPRIPLWSAPSSNLANWTFLGALWEPEANSSLGSVLATGSNGYNFEVSGFFSLLDEDGNNHYFVNTGSEGGNVSFHESSHWALWYEGIVSRRSNGSAAFNPIAGGAADHGNLYALTSFNDTKHNRRVQYGWAPEDIIGDGGLFSTTQQGFQGSLSLPRELFIHTTTDVVNVDGSLSELGPSYATQQAGGRYTARTLGVRPLADVVIGLRNGTTQHSFSSRSINTTTPIMTSAGSHFELTATITGFTGRVGVQVATSTDEMEATTIYYDPGNDTVVVDRSKSSLIEGFNNASVTGYFKPYHLQPQLGGNATVESIRWDVFLDGSLLEVYVNERFALTTRIYPSLENSTGLSLFADDGSSATFDNVNCWTDLYNVWPQRPLNSSSSLVFDTAAQTNNYTWWAGN